MRSWNQPSGCVVRVCRSQWKRGVYSGGVPLPVQLAPTRLLPQVAVLPYPILLMPAVRDWWCVQVRAPLEKKLQENPRFLESLTAEIEALAAELVAADQGTAS